MTLKPDKALDDYIIAASRIGDKAALDQLVRRWQPRLIAHAYRMIGDSELAKDVTQDAWVDIIRSLKRLQETRAFPAWAFRIVSRRSADVIKKRQSVRSLKSALDGEPKDKNEAQRRTDQPALKGRGHPGQPRKYLPNTSRKKSDRVANCTRIYASMANVAIVALSKPGVAKYLTVSTLKSVLKW